jgi:hypothetical protein
MCATSLSWESVHRISSSWVDVLIDYVLLYRTAYCDCCVFTTDPTHDSMQFCANLVKSATETLATIKQAFGKKTWAVHGKSKARQVKRKIKRVLITFPWHLEDCSQRICPGRPKSTFRILQWLFTVTRWKYSKLSPHEFCRQKNWLLHHDKAPCSTSFTREFFWTKATWLSSPNLLTFLCFPDRR